jgi:hypothetical protein
MKYLYLNIDENRVVTISNKRIEELAQTLTEYVVQDNFDLTKDMPSEDGQGTVKLEGFLTAQEFIERFNNNYSAKRTNAYPSIEEQLDMQYWDKINGTTNWEDEIARIKLENPKQ